jgi:hypothetical protein
MITRLALLWAYRCLLRLYPPAFRERFATEMLELAGEAEVAEWPLITDGDLGAGVFEEPGFLSGATTFGTKGGC